jgi:hypothetical protein
MKLAHEYFERRLSIDERVYNKDSYNYACTLNNIGSVYDIYRKLK